jgi:hypothetical protein
MQLMLIGRINTTKDFHKINKINNVCVQLNNNINKKKKNCISDKATFSTLTILIFLKKITNQCRCSNKLLLHLEKLQSVT